MTAKEQFKITFDTFFNEYSSNKNFRYVLKTYMTDEEKKNEEEKGINDEVYLRIFSGFWEKFPHDMYHDCVKTIYIMTEKKLELTIKELMEWREDYD